QPLDRAKPRRPLPAAPIGLHIIGKDRVGEKRHMAEDIMEDVGFFKIVDMSGRANEAPGDKAPIGEMIKEDLVGHEAGHRDHLPARGIHQSGVEFDKIGNPRFRQAQNVQPFEKGRSHTTGQKPRLALEQVVPHRMFVIAVTRPFLRDGPILSGLRGFDE
ncbi:hypothetical protein KXV85_006017, partial [Aspergillus fumigatus]